MKAAIILCFLGVVAVTLAKPKEEAHYTSKYDGIDLDELISNKRLLMPYVKCVLDQAKCTQEGKELKSHLQDALETDCKKCTETQRAGAEKVFRHLIKNEKEIWEQLKAKYDPSGKYSRKYEAEIRKLKSS